MLQLNATGKTPAILFDTQTGMFSITGRSLTENSYDFYNPLLEVIKEYKKQPQVETTINIQLFYFNTSSSKSILDILLEFESLKANSNIVINWHYEKEDQDMLEAGENYSILVDLPFKMIEINEVK
jgi:hypothetical protein